MSLTWTDSRDLGELNPLTVRFVDLHKWVLDIEDFEGKPEESNEKRLEAIQMAWYEEWKEEYGEG
jgi:FeS assembly protein IscX